MLVQVLSRRMSVSKTPSLPCTPQLQAILRPNTNISVAEVSIQCLHNHLYNLACAQINMAGRLSQFVSHSSKCIGFEQHNLAIDLVFRSLVDD